MPTPAGTVLEILRRRLSPGIEPLEQRIAPAAISWTGGGNGASWTDPNNWSGGAVPSGADDVTINPAGVHTITISSGAQAAHSISVPGDDTLAITGGSLALGIGGSISNLAVNGGALSSAGLLHLTGGSTWGSGSLSGAIRNEGALAITNYTVQLSSGILENSGTITIDDGYGLTLQAGAKIHNLAGGSFTANTTFNVDGGNIFHSDGSGVLFENDGVFQGNGGYGPLYFGAPLLNHADGVIEATHSTLYLNTSGTVEGGLFSALSGATLRLDGGSLVVTGALSGSGAGTIYLGSGTLTGSATASLNFPAGLLQIADRGVLSGHFLNDGYVQIATGTPALSAATIENAGNFVESGGGYLQFTNGSVFHNLHGGTFRIGFDTTLNGASAFSVTGAGSRFENDGLIQRDGGQDVRFDGLPLLNHADGQIEVVTGTLQLNTSGTLEGGLFNSHGGATLLLDGTSLEVTGTLNGTGAGLVRLGSGTLTGVGAATLNLPAGMFQVENAGILQGHFVNSGYVQIGGGAPSLSAATIDNAGNFVESGGGYLQFTNASLFHNLFGGIYRIAFDTTLNGSPGFSVTGAGSRFENDGLIQRDGGQDVRFDGLPLLNHADGQIEVVRGTLQLNTSGTLEGGLFNSHGGATLLLDGTSLEVTGTLNGTGAGVVQLGSSTLTGAGAATLNFPAGMFQVENVGVLQGQFLNSGYLQFSGGTPGLHAATLANSGVIVQSQGYVRFDGGSVLHNLPGALYDLKVGATLDGAIAFASSGQGNLFLNQGRIESDGSGNLYWNGLTLDNPGSVKVLSGGLFFDPSLVQEIGDTLTGGSWEVEGGARLQFGMPSLTANGGSILFHAGARSDGLTALTLNTGTLSLLDGASLTGFNNLTNSGIIDLSKGSVLAVPGYTQTPTGSLEIEVGGAAATDHGQLVVSNQASLDGALRVTLSPTYVPQAGQVVTLASFTSKIGDFSVYRGLNAGHAPLFEHVLSDTSLALNALVNAADLQVQSVTAPSSGFAGQNISFSYTVQNIAGNATPAAAWTDTVYLSKSGVVDANSIIIARIPHSGALAAGASYTANGTAPLPGALPDNYRVIVIADAQGFVADTNRANNALASAGALALDVPSLTADATFRGVIANGQDEYFKVTLPGGKTPTFTLTGAVAGEAALYESLGSVPTLSTFDASGFQAGSTVQYAAGQATAPATYYILLHGREAAGDGAGQSFSLVASGIGFSLDGTSVTQGANIGNVTMALSGSQFSPGTSFTLVPVSGPARPASAVYFNNSQKAEATFNLTGLAAGNYNIVASDGGSGATLPAAFTVLNGGEAGKLEFHLEAPRAVRSPFGGAIATLVYGNIGSTDLEAPLFTLLAENAKLRLAGQADFLAGSDLQANGKQLSAFELLGVGGGLAGVLSPGEERSIQVFFQPIDQRAHQFSILDAIVVGDTNTPLTFSGLKSALKPEQIGNDAWNTIFSNFQAITGGTIASYHHSLAENADYLSQLGPVSPEVTKLLAFELEQAGNFGGIGQHYALGDLGRGNDAPFSLHLSADSQGDITLGEGAAARFFVRQPDGSYHAAADAPATLSRTPAGVFTLRDVEGTKTVFRPSDGHIDYTEDATGRRITAAWNGDGKLLSLTDSSTGDVESFTYNAQGRMATSTDAVGHLTTYGYDGSGEHLLSVATPQGTTTFTYVTGQGAASEHALASVTTPQGVTTLFTYDGVGRLLTKTVGSGADAVVTHFSYSGPGLVKITDAENHLQQDFIGLGGNVVREIDPTGKTTSVKFDGLGRFAGIVAADGTATTVSYSSAGTASTFTGGDGSKGDFSVTGDPLRIDKVSAPGGGVISYDHDAQGRLVQTHFADGSSLSYAYNTAGEVSSTTDANGAQTQYTYNAAGLPTHETLPGGAGVDFTYDAHRNLLTATDAGGATTYTYDAADRVTGASYPNGKSVAITYDAQGRRATIADQSGYTVRYSYDSLSRLDEVRDTAGNLLVDYDYNPDGILTTETRGNGSTTSYSYDAAGRVADITHRDAGNSIIAEFAYTYDVRGRIATCTTNDGTTTYSYDTTGQLSGVALPGGRTIAYTYDAHGNRTVVADSTAGTTNYTTNAGDEYISAGGATLSYDAAGRLITRTEGGATTSYGYDSQGRLLSVTKPGSAITYTYDALGNRIGVTENGVRTDFAFDPAGLGAVFGEYQGSNSVNYATGLGLEARASGGITDYYHFDARGNTALLSGAGGSSVETYRYLPFGEISAQNGSLAQPFTFAGRFGVQGDGSGQFQMRARIYDAGLGRFTTRDPLGLASGDSNFYRYVGNNPANRSDPSGLEDFFVGVNGDLIVGGGVTGSGGGFFNVDDVLDAGGFISVGDGAGFSVGASVTGGVSSDISGVSHNATISSGGVTATVSTNAGDSVAQDGLHVTGVSGGAVFGTGDVLSGTLTTTYTVKLSPRALLNALGFPKPEITTRNPEVIFGHRLDALVQHSGDSALYNELVQNGLQAGKNRQDAILDAITFLRKNRIYDAHVNPQPAPVETILPHDPNNIVGPEGPGADPIPDTITPGQTRFDGFVPAGGSYDYRIEFENKATATAPAQVVTVTEMVDPNLDLSTFAFTGFGFGASRVEAPASESGTSFHTIYDATATLGVKVKIDATLNTQTGALVVTYTSLDPNTNDVPLDPYAGFLPPDNGLGSGDGYVTYSVKPKTGLASDTSFTAGASIVFDTEAAIATPTIHNTLDSVAPTSSVQPFAETTTNRPVFKVRWSSSDDIQGSGVAGDTVFYTDTFAGMTSALQRAAVIETSGAFRFTGAVGHTYAFFSEAVDRVGNVEPIHAAPDASITVVAPTLVPTKDGNGRLHVFTDSDGDIYTVALQGPGTLNAVLLDPGHTGKGPLDELIASGTTAKSSISVLVKKAHGGDGFVSMGDVVINGSLGAFLAPHSDLVVNGLTATGAVSLISLHDVLQPDPILANPTITTGGTTHDRLVISVHNIADGATIATTSSLTALTAAQIGTDTITAPSLGRLTTLSGGMAATLNITGPVGAVTVSKGLASGNWTASSFGAVAVTGGDLAANLTASGLVKSIAISGGNLTGSETAGSFGVVTVRNGNISGGIQSTASAAALGRNAAIGEIAVFNGSLEGSVTALGGIGPVLAIAGKTGSGAVAGGAIAGGSLRELVASGSVSDSLTLSGAAGPVLAGAIAGVNWTAASFSLVGTTHGALSANLTATGSIGALSAAGGDLSGVDSATHFGAVSVTGGNFTGTLSSSAAAADLGKTPALGALTITGGNLDGRIGVLGAIGQINVRAGRNGGGNAVGATVFAEKIAALIVARDFTNSQVYAGANLGADFALGGSGASADTFAPGSIGLVAIGGDVSAGAIAAGLSAPSGKLKDGSNTVVGGAASAIGRFVVGGKGETASADSDFVAGKFTYPPFLDGVKISDPSADPRFLVG